MFIDFMFAAKMSAACKVHSCACLHPFGCQGLQVNAECFGNMIHVYTSAVSEVKHYIADTSSDVTPDDAGAGILCGRFVRADVTCGPDLS